jgi:hypothetical protein
MSLRLDNYVKRKVVANKGFTLDKRKFKLGRTKEEILINNLEQELREMNFKETRVLIEEFLKIRNIEKLNHRLLGIVYKYFEDRDFDFSNVVQDFDKDFKYQIKIIKENEDFKNLNSAETVYKFRQDFTTYLFLIDEMRNRSYEFEEGAEEFLEEEGDAIIDEEDAVDFKDENVLGDEYERD